MGIWKRLQQAGLNTTALDLRYDENLIEEFVEFWEEYNEVGGFFSKEDAGRILSRHVFECLVCLEASWKLWTKIRSTHVSRETKIADVGSGPGLPGLLLCADLDFKGSIVLMDSSKRRLELVEKKFADRFRNLHFDYRRVEEVKEKYDIVLARAFLPYPISAEVVCKMLGGDGVFMIFAGRLPELDNIQEQQYLKRLGFVSRETRHIPELEFLGQRHIIGLRQIDKPFDGYPRSWKKIKGSLSKWKRSSH